MDGNLASRNMIPGASYGILDLQGYHDQFSNSSLHHHHQQTIHAQNEGSLVYPSMHDCDHQLVFPMMDYENKGEIGKNSMSDEDDPSLSTDDGVLCQNEVEIGKKASLWQRMKWTYSMVRLLITALSYLGEDAVSDCSNSRRGKVSIMQKKGKWKLISKVLAEKGCYVSPQQCEDKFNDLNKRYKKLTDILGRGTSCKVVENPALLDLMDHIPDKAKNDVRKILSSKHLFYEEMCSFHNGNRLNLPANPALQQSLQLALRSKDVCDMKRASQEYFNEDDEGNADEVPLDNNVLYGDIAVSCGGKRMKHGLDHEEVDFAKPSVSMREMQVMRYHSIQTEEKILRIQSLMLELEKQRFKWQNFSKDRELDKIRIENERIKIKNGRLALELKRKRLDLGLN